MQEIAIPFEGFMVAVVEGVTGNVETGGITAMVTWRVVAGRITADVLRDQVPLEAGMSEAEIVARLTARGQQVAGEYLAEEADEEIAQMRVKLGLS